jgi:hypothetical protein
MQHRALVPQDRKLGILCHLPTQRLRPLLLRVELCEPYVLRVLAQQPQRQICAGRDFPGVSEVVLQLLAALGGPGAHQQHFGGHQVAGPDGLGPDG